MADDSRPSRLLRLALVAICGASALLLVVLGTRLSFFSDDWYFLLQRPGLSSHGGIDVLLAPHNGNLVAVDVIIYKGLVGAFGLRSQLPFRLVLASLVVSVGVLVYLLVSERLGRMPGVIAATVVLFLGPAWEDLLFIASIDLIGSLATGLAALLLLEKDTGRRNPAACGLLVCSVLMSNLGLAFVVAAAVAVALRRRPAQLCIPLAPMALFGVWWIVYGSDASSSVSVANLVNLPRFILESIASGLASLTGLNRGSGTSPYVLGGIVLVLVSVVVGVRWRRGARVSPWILVFVAAAFTFWTLTGLSYDRFLERTPSASRYQLIDASLLLVILAELFRSMRLGAARLAVMLVIAVLVLVSNGDVLGSGYRFMHAQSRYVMADLGALNIVRANAPSSQRLVGPDLFLSGITAGRYFSEAGAHGSPPFYSPVELAAAPGLQRQEADNVLIASDVITTSSDRRRSAGRCQTVQAGSVGDAPEVTLRSGGLLVSNLARRHGEPPARVPPQSPPVTLQRLAKQLPSVRMRRFGPIGASPPLAFVLPGKQVRIAVKRDSLNLPWHVTLSNGRFELCRE